MQRGRKANENVCKREREHEMQELLRAEDKIRHRKQIVIPLFRAPQSSYILVLQYGLKISLHTRRTQMAAQMMFVQVISFLIYSCGAFHSFKVEPPTQLFAESNKVTTVLAMMPLLSTNAEVCRQRKHGVTNGERE